MFLSPCRSAFILSLSDTHDEKGDVGVISLSIWTVVQRGTHLQVSVSRHWQEVRGINVGMHGYPNEIRGSGLDMGEVADLMFTRQQTHTWPSPSSQGHVCLSNAIINMPFSISKQRRYVFYYLWTVCVFLGQKKLAEKNTIRYREDRKRNEKE